MTEETLRVLEYDKVRQLLAAQALTVAGRRLVEALHPLDEADAVRAALEEVSEMVWLLDERGRPPLGGCRDLQPCLTQLRTEGTWLQPEVLLDIRSTLEATVACRGYFAEGEKAQRLSLLAAGLQSCRDLYEELRRSIGLRGEILDSASFELGTLRQDMLQVRTRIKRALESLLGSDRLAGVFQDQIITERHGRYVLPVKADHRGRVKGFVHDESASGQTLFVEPTSVLDANNELQTLQREEKREEERILRRLADSVRRQAEVLRENQRILAHLDGRTAAARLSLLMDGVAPELVETPVLELRAARHPLLLFHADGSRRDKGAVPVDIRLGEQRGALIISGPNTGGKTVALKTAGLLLLMAKSGLHIPCHADSRVYLFRHVFADIGDEQSIEADLSTFSGHLQRVRRLLEQADDDSLVLLDEAGTGTDPAEGGALALAVLDTLRERGTRVLVTTHLNVVKHYAWQRPDVENAAVEFDRQTLRPTYRLHYGMPGASSAFTIARCLGLPEEVLQRAESYLGVKEREGEQQLEALNRLSHSLEQEQDELRSLRVAAEQDREKRRRLLAELETQKRSIIEKTTRRAEQKAKEAERQLRVILKEARGAGVDAREQAELNRQLREVKEALGRAAPTPAVGAAPKQVAVGEILRVPALGAEGVVVRAMDDEAELNVQGKKIRLPLVQLEAFSPRRFEEKQAKKSKIQSRVERDRFSPRLLLVGQRAEEALIALDRFIDDALLQGVREVEVVHGSGTGILRRVVRDFLAGHRGVQAFRGADLAQGGDNVTLVELRR
ncbi:endonuclease MutS2 [Desulfuromonas sp. AOP6]|uniref:endonuclease MutS2 n=1 Tax=Desulfuromonas sp. AOP6 TaxID=1566351 RepID=UPI0012789129|nr:endonuclease MutS2 [Desulfuromonas sp. AOP6]BCA78606.1 endonuclease MutS2 [Desulfuromonas sp. AOP6]